MKYPADISAEEYAAMEEGYEQGRASAEIDSAMFWDVFRERDDYRSRVAAVVPRIESASSRITDPTGAVTGLVLPIEDWRSIRSMLQREHQSAPSVPPST